jgi:molybdenum cofactor cytidylyltransferase
MGKNKLNLPLGGGATVLEQTVSRLSEASFSQHLLVVRARQQIPFNPSLYGFDCLEIGDDASAGMHRSLKRGLARVVPEAQAAMICLGDQPFVLPTDYRLIMSAYSAALAEGFDLLYPTRSGQRGNPAILHRRYFAEIYAEPDTDRGCRYLFERYPDHTRAWETNVESFFRDLDTLEDYQACLN